jgi:hypothetical protein
VLAYALCELGGAFAFFAHHRNTVSTCQDHCVAGVALAGTNAAQLTALSAFVVDPARRVQERATRRRAPGSSRE